MKLVPHAGNVAYYVSIMFDAFRACYAQNYAGIIDTSLPIRFVAINIAHCATLFLC